jgi:hypothetical protein
VDFGAIYWDGANRHEIRPAGGTLASWFRDLCLAQPGCAVSAAICSNSCCLKSFFFDVVVLNRYIWFSLNPAGMH